jgi:hypothetical protein
VVIDAATRCRSGSCQSRWDQPTPVVGVKGMKAENPTDASVRLSTAPEIYCVTVCQPCMAWGGLHPMCP